MGRVRDDLERQRVERLAAELVPMLRERGEVKVETNALKSLERWRAAARRLSATKVCSSTWLAVLLNDRSTDYLPVGLLRDLRV